MAHATVNLSYIGQGEAAGGQIVASVQSGPAAKTLYAYGTLTNGSSTFCTETTAGINFIDGVQSFSKVIILPLTSVAVDATTSTYADYFTGAAVGQIKVNDVVSVTGFTNSGNNVTNLTVTKVFNTGFIASNSGVVAETNPAATVTDVQGGTPAMVSVWYAGSAGDSTTAAASYAGGTNFLAPSNLSNTGFTLNHNSLVTTGVTITFGALIAFSS